ncbi:MAG: tetraacyldisaccharide 4'-kinase [Pseudomonadota bacterium]
MSPAWQQRLLRAWYEGSPWLWLLRPVEALFRAVVSLRRWLFQAGLLSRYRAPVPVVVVGNITLGGTGKTPIVIALVEALTARGQRVGVVSRGYGARGLSFPHLVSAGDAATSSADEALLIAQRTGCPVAIGPDRSAAARLLLESHDVDLLVADDGLQHYALVRDFEIAVIDYEQQLGNGFCLPAGPLREPASRLASVDRVLYRGLEDEQQGVVYRVEGLVNLADGDAARLGGGAVGPEVHGLAGIGQPGQFFTTLESAGLSVERHIFPDHHAFSASDLTALADKPVIMTEKDAVKCEPFATAAHWYLKISAELPAELVQRVHALTAR